MTAKIILFRKPTLREALERSIDNERPRFVVTRRKPEPPEGPKAA